MRSPMWTTYRQPRAEPRGMRMLEQDWCMAIDFVPRTPTSLIKVGVLGASIDDCWAGCHRTSGGELGCRNICV